jgi:hypothetical protein
MRIFMIECTEDELRANRGIMDAIVDACSGLLSGLYGNCTPSCEEFDDNESEESEDNYEADN